MSCLLADFVVFHLCGRLRQVDIKAEHFERQVQRVEQERDTWTTKYEVCVTITGRCIRLVSHEVASLIVDSSRRKWKPNIASRKQSWTNSLRTWRVSNLRVWLLLHLYTAMPIHGANLSSRGVLADMS
jgi:Tropomyosin like